MPSRGRPLLGVWWLPAGVTALRLTRSVTKPTEGVRNCEKVSSMILKKAALVTIACLALASCSSGSSEPATTTTVAPETTIAATTLPPVPDCSKTAIEVAVGEPASYFTCSGEWASTMPDSYTANCGECESLWLLKWEDATWNLRGVCSQYSVLDSEAICSGLSGTVANSVSGDLMTEFPPAEDACKIWPANRYESSCTTG